MISTLFIQNFALIDRLSIDFSNGLIGITGETGAGKSIIIGALGLVLGDRADQKAITDDSKKCIVEATFNISNLDIQDLFTAQDLDYEDLTTIRREIAPGGKSRAFVNDTPVKLTDLRMISSRIIDIHSQNTILEIGTERFQMSVLDSLSSSNEILKSYQQHYRQLNELNHNIHRLESDIKEKQEKKDYLQYLLDEVLEADIKDNEQNELEQELKLQSNVQELKTLLTETNIVLDGDDGVLNSLARLNTQLSGFKDINEELDAIYKRFNSVLIELGDLSSDINRLDEGVEYNPQRLQQIESRLDELFKLFSKHHVNSIEELLQRQNSIDGELQGLDLLNEELSKKIKEKEEVFSAITDLAHRLTIKRSQVIPKFEKQVLSTLADMEMDKSRFNIKITELTDLNYWGRDKVEFLFNANPSGNLYAINTMASGGEMSRIMLALKSNIAQHMKLPSIIFDEIDSGVSGEVAIKVGTIIKRLSQHLQVIVITHQPQIAAKVDHHYLVIKKTESNLARSLITKLSDESRVEEIAKMLSGKDYSRSAVETAEQLIKTKI